MPEPPTLEEIRAARERIAPYVLRTPLVRLETDAPGPEIWLKLECLQPIGSFKLRGASNAMALAPPGTLAHGVWTMSAGNMAQGVAWQARRLGVPCAVLVPDHAPAAKLDAVRRLGGRVVPVPFAEWWRALETRAHPAMSGLCVHPVSDTAVIAGNGTIGLEIADDLEEVDAVLVPYGGGGLSCGIASALKALRPRTRVYACEVETAAPFAAALAAGAPQKITHTPSFVDGIGGTTVLDEMWPLARGLLAGSRVVTLAAVAAAIRMLVARARVVAEGAGGSSLAAALAGGLDAKRIVCVISGGNIDSAKLATILSGEVP